MPESDHTGLDVHDDAVDGVPAIWATIDGDYCGALVFGVGNRDLTPATVRLHHLVEHLVMRRVGRLPVENNAASSLDSTLFYAVGEPSQVAEFLGRVASAVSKLDTLTDADIALEVATIATEVGPQTVYAATGPLSLRWGVAGLGLADLGHAPLASFTAEDVRRFARRWLVAQNARVVLTGPPPEGLRLALPSGDRPARPEHPEPVPGELPALGWVAGAGITLSMIVEGGFTVRAVAGAVIEEAMLRRLRMESGHVYSAELVSWWLGQSRALWLIALDPDDAHVEVALTAARDVLRALATDGPDNEVLSHAQDSMRASWRSTDGRRGWLFSRAEAELAGLSAPSWEMLTEGLRAVTADEVASLVSAGLPSLIMTIPEHIELSTQATEQLDAEHVTPRRPYRTYESTSSRELMRDLLTNGQPPAGRGSTAKALFDDAITSHHGKWSGPHRGHDMWLGPHQIALPDLGVKIPVSEIALIGKDDDGDYEIVTAQGGVLYINPDHWRGAAKPWEKLVGSMPDEVVRHKPGFPRATGAR